MCAVFKGTGTTFENMMVDFGNVTVGVLALQGDFEKHQAQIRALGAKVRLVRLPGDFEGIDALILPGGESTTMSILMDKHQLRQPLALYAMSRPTYGTCAGMILLATNILDNQSGVTPLGLMDIDVLRNGYGRQVFSFEEPVAAQLPGGKVIFPASFIRAPRVVRSGDSVELLAKRGSDPILLRQGKLLASSFHNELGEDMTVLTYFLVNFLGDKR